MVFLVVFNGCLISKGGPVGRGLRSGRTSAGRVFLEKTGKTHFDNMVSYIFIRFNGSIRNVEAAWLFFLGV